MGEHEWDYLIDPVRGIGYIRLTGFLEQTPEEFDRAVQEAKREAGSVGLRGLILDLRFNPGGQLTASIEIANRFVADGVIVSTEGGRASIPRHQRARRSRAAALEGVRVAVLINQGSASASEIVSGCLKDHDRAVIIGERSYGKGSVQKIEAISGGEALLKLTSEYYVLPKGGIIHREADSTTWGVDPHLLVRMTPKRVVDTLKVRQNADVLLDRNIELTEEQRAERNPNRLLMEPLDLQLQTGLLMLQSRLLESFAESAMLIDVGR